jgi:hypothetical protein
MDDIVAQSLKKWPNVPHCYGWLALDARGHWRMRDQQTQDNDLPGDKIAHTALIGFINRNYDCDARGRWYFQNGPQRVYVDLALAPFIAKTDPLHGFSLHTGVALERIDQVWLSDAGCLLLQFSEGKKHSVAALDDRDLAECLPLLHIGASAVGDAELMAWIDGKSAEEITLRHRGQALTVQRVAHADIAQQFQFAPKPEPDA